MPRSNNDKFPLFYVTDGPWPQVVLAPTAPLSAHCGLLLARDLDRTMRSRELSLRGLAEMAQVAHSTVARVLNGEVLPDIGTLTRLEDALDLQLWPGPAAVRAAAAGGTANPGRL
ncbi:helix-turn-helix domain-containing protein [Streptomyces phaeolivaceus]|nr:helix-turn-helix transcriptional regulator [Streptomyces phaeolivaceus]